jgi:hypothetical protein
MNSRPTFIPARNNQSTPFTNNASQMRGGFMGNDDLYLYKAKKYHYKCQMKLKEMMARGESVPAGYEKYLQPFTA